MNRRNFIKKVGLSIVVATILAPKELLAVTNTGDEIVIHLFCYGGADFRYMFAPLEEQEELNNAYFENQMNLISDDEYKNIEIDGKNYNIKNTQVGGLEDMIKNSEVAIIPGVWFSDNRDHQHSIARNLLGDNDLYEKSTTELDGWLGRLAGNTNKNAITSSDNWIFAARTNSFPNSESINVSIIRPFGITNTTGIVNKALQRYYKTETNENESVMNLVNTERTLKLFSDRVNDRLSNTTKITTGVKTAYLRNQIVNTFDAIDCRDIFNSNYFHIDFPGWDFHGNYKAFSNINIPDIFGSDGSLATIKKEMLKRGLWNKTTVIVSSEFGRQLKENGIEGKDHGHGNLMFVAGGSVNGGIHGEIFPESEIPLWDKVGGEIEGKTMGYEIFGKVVENIKPGLGKILFPVFGTGKIETDFNLYKI
jgi:uncharacterized protein (DUF1501 family)